MEQTNSTTPNQVVNGKVTSEAPRRAAICEHVKDDGIRCGTPAIRDRHFCYFHSRAHRPSPRIGHTNYAAPVMESKQALEIAVTHVLQALTCGDLSPRLANSMFYGIHLAAKILRMADQPAAPPMPDVITEVPRTMECLIAGRPLPEPIDYRPDKVEQLAVCLLHHDEIVSLYRAMENGPSDPFYAQHRRRVEEHSYATRRLRDMGLFDKYNLNPELFAPAREAQTQDGDDKEGQPEGAAARGES